MTHCRKCKAIMQEKQAKVSLLDLQFRGNSIKQRSPAKWAAATGPLCPACTKLLEAGISNLTAD